MAAAPISWGRSVGRRQRPTGSCTGGRKARRCASSAVLAKQKARSDCLSSYETVFCWQQFSVELSPWSGPPGRALRAQGVRAERWLANTKGERSSGGEKGVARRKVLRFLAWSRLRLQLGEQQPRLHPHVCYNSLHKCVQLQGILRELGEGNRAQCQERIRCGLLGQGPFRGRRLSARRRW